MLKNQGLLDFKAKRIHFSAYFDKTFSKATYKLKITLKILKNLVTLFNLLPEETFIFLNQKHTIDVKPNDE